MYNNFKNKHFACSLKNQKLVDTFILILVGIFLGVISIYVLKYFSSEFSISEKHNTKKHIIKHKIYLNASEYAS